MIVHLYIIAVNGMYGMPHLYEIFAFDILHKKRRRHEQSEFVVLKTKRRNIAEQRLKLFFSDFAADEAETTVPKFLMRYIHCKKSRDTGYMKLPIACVNAKEHNSLFTERQMQIWQKKTQKTNPKKIWI